MSFTADEQEKIRRYFGYPAATGWMHQIQNFCNRVSVASAEAEAAAKSLLLEIDKIELQVQKTKPFATRMSQPEMEDTSQPTLAQQLSTLKQEQASLVQELSKLLELPIHREMFGGGGWQMSGRLRHS